MRRFHAPLGTALIAFASAAQAQVWSQPSLMHALAGRGDVLAAATDGGVVLWDLTSGACRRVGTEGGLPSNQVAALALEEHVDVLLGATSAGLARGWWEGPWAAAPRGMSPGDIVFRCAIPRPGGGFLAGGSGGTLAAWNRDSFSTLPLPSVNAPVVALAVAPGLVATESAGVAVAPDFPPGLAAATNGEGLWLLCSFGARTQWRTLTTADGLLSDSVHALAADPFGRLWVATARGLARVRRGLVVDAWPGDPALGGLVHALVCGPNGALYLGLSTGIAQLDPRCEHPCVQHIVSSMGAVSRLAFTDGELWWTTGDTVRSLSGRTRTLAPHVQQTGRSGARWQPTPLWPGASAAEDPAAATGPLRVFDWPRRGPAGGRGSGAPTDLAPHWFDVRGRRLAGPAQTRGIYFVPIQGATSPRTARRVVLLEVEPR